MYSHGIVTIATTGTAVKIGSGTFSPTLATKKVAWVNVWALTSNAANAHVGDSTVKNDGTDTNPIPPGGFFTFPAVPGPNSQNALDLDDLYVNGQAGDKFAIDLVQMLDEEIIYAVDIKNLVGNVGTGEDTILAILAAAVSDFIKGFCGDAFILKTYTAERYDGNGRDYLYLKHRPVISVSALSDDGATIAADDFLVYDDRIELKSGDFSEVRQGISVTYQAGYATIPEDLKLAAAWIAKYWFSRRKTLGFSSEFRAGGSIVVDKASIPEEALAILQNGGYMRAMEF